MLEPDFSSEHADSSEHLRDALCDTASGYKKASLELDSLLASAPNSWRIPTIKRRREHYAVRLFELIEPGLLRIASQWSERSGMAQDMRRNPSYETRRDIERALARSTFLDILSVLTTSTIDLDGNPHSYLMTIAWRSLERQHSRIYSRRSRENDPRAVHINEGIEQDAIDDSSDEAFERVISAMSAPSCLKATYEHWREKLDLEDWKIIITWLRGIAPNDQEIVNLANIEISEFSAERWRIMTIWLCDRPKLTSQEIAELMGPGWTHMQVRTRIHRIIQETKEFLQGHGYEEFAGLKDITMNENTVAILRTPAARRFWEKKYTHQDRQIITLCTQEGIKLTYQEIAEQLGPKRRAGKIRERANRMSDEIIAYLRASGDIQE
jgi:hypothetical protein